MIKDIWDIGKEIFNISNELKKQTKEKKTALSTLLQHIGDVLKDTYEKLLKDFYPAGNCEQLAIFSKELYEALKDIIGETKAEQLVNKLMQAHEVELLYHEISSGKIDKKELLLLDESSGYFIAVSKMLLI